MKNEMLEYWEYQVVLNTILANTTESNINILQRSIDLSKKVINHEIRGLYGDCDQIQDCIDNFSDMHESHLYSIRIAKLQVKSLRKFRIQDMYKIDENQKN
jgi:hypothetical protein